MGDVMDWYNESYLITQTQHCLYTLLCCAVAKQSARISCRPISLVTSSLSYTWSKSVKDKLACELVAQQD
eukprot:1383847-Amphidinium_carterae.1